LFQVVHQAGTCLSELSLDFGNDDNFRPIPTKVLWEQAQVTVTGEILGFIDYKGRHLELTPCTRVWDNIILEIKQVLRCEPETYMTLNGGPAMGVDPYWTVDRFRKEYNLGQEIFVNDEGRAKLQSGYLLKDYGVISDYHQDKPTIHVALVGH
jgi:hypothetical protein